MKFSTYSGSEYEIQDGMVRRLNSNYGKRADGEWIWLIEEPVVKVGESAILRMKSLSSYGEDDLWTPREHTTAITTRITSTVTEIYYD